MYRQNNHYYNIKAEINLKNIIKNLSYLKSQLSASVKVMAVVKADAYGLGAVSVSRYLENDVFQFGVATIQEAIELRKNGITKPIAVFAAPTASTVSLYYLYHIQPVISGTDQFSLFQKPIDAHIQFNTGMHRFGIAPNQLSQIDQLLNTYSHIHPVGICSHFATSADPESGFVNSQFEMFESLCTHASFVDENVIRHIANTGGILFYPHTACDMVRPGIGLYGGYPGNTVTGTLCQALSLTSFVINTHQVKKGEAVSYDLTWKAPQDGDIAVIPAGYADGIFRSMSGKMNVKIKNRYFKQVGRVTMDYILVFIPEGKKTPGISTEAVLMNEEEEMNLSWWSKQAGTISYEILTSLNKNRVLRVY